MWNDGAGIAYDDARKMVSCTGRLNRIGAAEPCGDIGSRKTVASGGRVDHWICYRFGRDPVQTAFEANDTTGVKQLQDCLLAANALDQLLVGLVRIDRQHIFRGGQHDVGGCKGLLKRAPHLIAITPAAGTEVGVKNNTSALLASASKRTEHFCAPLGIEDRERNC